MKNLALQVKRKGFVRFITSSINSKIEIYLIFKKAILGFLKINPMGKGIKHTQNINISVDSYLWLKLIYMCKVKSTIMKMEESQENLNLLRIRY